mmetsp:Transcript_127569/g.369307  ORF Transcript_127569/g.369307 Transcript_127569/m.369307 type:complete len:469 (-) Transcript_127569:62-1468(-)
MGNFFGGGNADEEEEEDDERLRRWRPALEPVQYGALKRRKLSSKSSDSSEDGSQSDGQSVSSSASKLESDSEKSEADDKSEKSGGSGKDESGDESEDDNKEIAQKDEKKKKKLVVRMDFEPLLSLHEPLAEDMEPPTTIFAHTKKRRKAERAERAALEDAMMQNRRKAKAASEWMADMGLEEIPLRELAQALGEDPDELRYALVQSRRFSVDDEGIVRRELLQRILDVMTSDIETLQEIVDKLMDYEAEEVKAAIEHSHGELRLKLANDIELVEHVDLEAEMKLQREEEKERRLKEKEERLRAKMRKKKGKGDAITDGEESSESSSDEDGGGLNKEAEKRALAFRRLQVQRKIEEFLKIYTRGQNLTKINNKGIRYHRRVYVDTSRKALVVQGANGPKFFPFASMKEVDLETRTTKEGRVETLVICAIEKRGRIVKELYLAFPDQARASTFVNCVTLFSLALRHAGQK